MMHVLNKIKMVKMPSEQYVDEVVENKVQLYVHHTAGNGDPYSVINWWNQTPDRIATAFIIAGKPNASKNWQDGDIIQAFHSSKWAWHLGLKQSHLQKGGPSAKTNTYLNKYSIGIEICNWGWLKLTDKGFVNFAGGLVADDEVVEYATPYKGYKYYQKYTPMQLDNTKELLAYLCSKWDIPKEYKGYEMFDVNAKALCGESGIWTHTSVRPDKFDCHPQPELIEMLKSI